MKESDTSGQSWNRKDAFSGGGSDKCNETGTACVISACKYDA